MICKREKIEYLVSNNFKYLRCFCTRDGNMWLIGQFFLLQHNICITITNYYIHYDYNPSQNLKIKHIKPMIERQKFINFSIRLLKEK